MKDEDNELEILKKKRLEEMQKNISFKQKEKRLTAEKNEKKRPSFRDSLVKHLGYRGIEVLTNAEYQYPRESKIIVDKLGELIVAGEIDEEIDGGQLLALFRSVGIKVRMQTKINVKQDGKYISLSDKIGKSYSDDTGNQGKIS